MNAYELAELLEDVEPYINGLDDLTLSNSVAMLRQQADRIAELEKDFAWAKDQWNKDRICFESRRNELEKDLALKTRDRDVFGNFTLAYEERIAELEETIEACYAVQKMQAEEVYKGNDRIAELEKLLEHFVGSDCREMRYIQEIENKDARIAGLEKELKRTKFAWNLAENEIERLSNKDKSGNSISAEEYQKTHEEFSTKAHERRGWEYAEELEPVVITDPPAPTVTV